jgi:uncharacterized protein (DUF305 family)
MTSSSDRGILSRVVYPFLTYLFLFVGMGLVAGSIVHFGQTDQIPRFAVMGIVGMVLFALGSYVQERLAHPGHISKGGGLRYVLYSLLLAIAIGMLSGGLQHFLDFPVYASYLLPIGFVLALITYSLRDNLSLTRKGWTVLLAGAVAIALPSFGALNLYAQTLPVSSGHHHGSSSPTDSKSHSQSNSTSDHSSHSGGQNSGNQNSSNHMSSHQMSVKTDAEFLLGMIPHHQEAVDTSAYLLTRTDNPDLQRFLQSVVVVQAREVHQMKQWHHQWFNKPYAPDGKYQPMMGDLANLKGSDLDRAYIEGMIGHHEGAIAMAKQALKFTQRPALKTMAEAIVRTQSEEVTQLQSWLTPASHSHQDGTPHNH